MKDKIAIVTGANHGIGYETTIGLAREGYIVVLACRNSNKASEAKSKILSINSEAKLDIIPLDLSNNNSIKNFVKVFKEKYSHLNILINNAGIYAFSGEKTKDGLSLSMQTNYFGHFLLTSLLLDMMPDETSSRIVSLASIVHKKARINFNDLNCFESTNHKKVYGQSKLACLMFGNELDRRLKKAGKNIVSVTAHPGFSMTNIFTGMPWYRALALKIFYPFFSHSHFEGAKPVLQVSLDSDIKGGEYLGPCGFMELKGKVGEAKRSKISKCSDTSSRLWEESLKITGGIFPYNI